MNWKGVVFLHNNNINNNNNNKNDTTKNTHTHTHTRSRLHLNRNRGQRRPRFAVGSGRSGGRFGPGRSGFAVIDVSWTKRAVNKARTQAGNTKQGRERGREKDFTEKIKPQQKWSPTSSHYEADKAKFET